MFVCLHVCCDVWLVLVRLFGLYVLFCVTLCCLCVFVCSCVYVLVCVFACVFSSCVFMCLFRRMDLIVCLWMLMRCWGLGVGLFYICVR